jgi:hypothetical protein
MAKAEKVGKWCLIKLEALLWVSISGYLLYYTNFFKQMFTHKAVNHLFLDIFLIAMGINCMITFLVAIVFPLMGIDDYEKVSKKITYVGAACGMLSFISCIIAVWNVWHFYTIPIILILFIGFI